MAIDTNAAPWAENMPHTPMNTVNVEQTMRALITSFGQRQSLVAIIDAFDNWASEQTDDDERADAWDKVVAAVLRAKHVLEQTSV